MVYPSTKRFLKKMKSQFEDIPVDYKTAEDQSICVWATQSEHELLNQQLNSPDSTPAKTISAIIENYQEERRKTGKFPRKVVNKNVKPEDRHRFVEPVISEAQARQEDLVAFLNTTINIKENLRSLQHDMKKGIESDNQPLQNPSLNAEDKAEILTH